MPGADAPVHLRQEAGSNVLQAHRHPLLRYLSDMRQLRRQHRKRREEMQEAARPLFPWAPTDGRPAENAESDAQLCQDLARVLPSPAIQRPCFDAREGGRNRGSEGGLDL